PSVNTPAARLAARAGHFALYALMFAVPLTGWLASSAQGVPVVWLGVWQLPDLIGKNPELGSRLQDAHMVLNYLLAAGVLGHVAGPFTLTRQNRGVKNEVIALWSCG